MHFVRNVFYHQETPKRKASVSKRKATCRKFPVVSKVLQFRYVGLGSINFLFPSFFYFFPGECYKNAGDTHSKWGHLKISEFHTYCPTENEKF